MNRNFPLTVAAMGFVLLTSAFGEDWPQWRGPGQDGISKETGVTPWKGEPKVLWRAKVGIGYSGFAVADGKAYIVGWAEGKDTVYCFDAENGKQIWAHSYQARKMDKFHPGGPGATPTVRDGLVYTISKEGHFFCLDATSGEVKWKHDLSQVLETKMPSWGYSSSAVIDGDLVIVDAGVVGAFDRKSGKPVWKSKAMNAGYATPILFVQGETKMLAAFNGEGLVLLDPTNGKSVGGYPWKTDYDVNAASPIVKGNAVFISSGYGRGATMLRLQGTTAQKVWENRDMKNQMNPSVLIDKALYGVDDNAGRSNNLICMEAETGKVLWKQPGLGCGSLIAADGKLMIFSEKGELVIAEANPTAYKELARGPILGSKSWTAPALANGRVYCRNDRGDVACVDVKGP